MLCQKTIGIQLQLAHLLALILPLQKEQITIFGFVNAENCIKMILI